MLKLKLIFGITTTLTLLQIDKYVNDFKTIKKKKKKKDKF